MELINVRTSVDLPDKLGPCSKDKPVECVQVSLNISIAATFEE